MNGRGKLAAVAAVFSAAAVGLVAGAVASPGGGTGSGRTLAAASPTPGKVCGKAGATAKGIGGVRLTCARRATGTLKGKLVWVAAKAKPPVSPQPSSGGSAGGASGQSSGGQSAPAPTYTAAQVAAGDDLYHNGAGSQGVACARCHGLDAMGKIGPKIVGKDAAQIRNAIGSVAQMGPFFGDLTSDQINDIAAYLQSLVVKK